VTDIKQNYFLGARSAELCVVAIGASAGGLEAINEFFDHMPEDSGLTFIVIQHLSPDYKSLLVELVAKHTTMQVFEAANDLKLQRNCIYIIPNKKLMTIIGAKLKLADKIADKSPNTAIDHFFFSLAQDKKDKAIAIVLSGTGTDGSKGIAAIKEFGGTVIVQEPTTAKFDGMPNSAITSGNADHIAAPKKMYLELESFLSKRAEPELNEDNFDNVVLNELFQLVSASSGQDFDLYKTPTILRRIARRMNVVEVADLKAYVEFLKENDKEIKLLAKDFLINVTKFFRDKPAFEIMAKDIIPEIISHKKDGDLFKIWVCACSTGEEAYTIAILIDDCLDKAGRHLDVKIFASDLDDASIEVAAKNSYPLTIAKEIPSPLLKKYFIKDRTSYSVIPAIRKQIVFAKHNVVKSPPFIKNDLITCRNMLIYMNNVLQQKIMATFHFSLLKEGYLFLGSSENASGIKDGITEINGKWKIYQKTGTINYGLHHTYTTVTPLIKKAPEKKAVSNALPENTVEQDFLNLIVEEFDSVAVFIDKNYTVRDTIGNYRQYLNLPEKKIDLNILNLVSRNVAVILNTAIRKAWKENKKTYLNKIRMSRAGEDVFLQITVKPPEPASTHGYTILMLTESKAEPGNREGIALSPIGPEDQQEHLLEVEAELIETRSNLQMAVEEMETTNEELQSSNEELMSANEELQSGNEELQSLNEELHTLNTEHQAKIRELVELNDDLDNYFKSTDIGQIFIDSNLNIRKFNPAAIKLVNLINADIGRPINHISRNIQYDNFINDIHAVLANGSTIEKEIELINGATNLMRIMPYIRKDRQKDGVIVSFIDISRITELSNIISGVFNASSAAIFAFKEIREDGKKVLDYTCIAYNEAALSLLSQTNAEFDANPSYKSLALISGTISLDKLFHVVDTGNPLQSELQVADGNWYQVLTAKMNDGFVMSLTRVTERRNAEQKLRKNYQELITVREGLKTLNLELEDRVSERTRKLAESEERFNLVAKATNDTIWDWNLVDNTMWRSETFVSMFGYERNEEANSINFWYDKIHPEDREQVKQSVNEAINSHQKQWTSEYRVLKADGDYAFILDRVSILEDEYSTPFRLVGSIVDVTARKEAEIRRIELLDLIKKQRDEFYSIFNNAPALITIRRGTDLIYEFANLSFREFVGQEEYIGRKSVDVHNEFNQLELSAIEQTVITNGEAYIGKACHLKKKALGDKDVEDYWFDLIINPVYAANGEIDGIAFFGFDVTTLIRANEATEELMHKKDEFMSIASHELKTPVTSLKGSLQILQRMAVKLEKNDQMISFIEKAAKQTGKLTVLLDDLLDVTKIQEGKLLLNYSHFDAWSMVKESVDEVRVQSHSHELIIDGDECIMEISADRIRLEQVMNNFLTNAIKYSPNGKKVVVKCAIIKNEFRVDIQDFGIGIPKSKKDYLFDRFYRVQESSTHFAGLGLGLYITAEIVKQHHGTLGVESSPGEGSTFWFSVPIHGAH
jgi:two-component system CheB/CheR fusion protein